MPDFKGLIVITGASRGIGLALVYCFLKAGFPVLAIARNAASMRPHKHLTSLDADLTDQTIIAGIADRVEMMALPIAVLINNAGIQNAIDFTEASIGAETIARMMRDEIALNLTVPILLIHSLLPLMLRPGGTIVNVTSLVSRQPKPSAPVYSATKAGLASFTPIASGAIAVRGNSSGGSRAAAGGHGNDRWPRIWKNVSSSHGPFNF